MNYIDAQSARKRYFEVKHSDFLNSDDGRDLNKIIYLAIEDGTDSAIFSIEDLSESTVDSAMGYLVDAGFKVTKTCMFGDEVLEIKWV